MRGFACVGLENPKKEVNVGGALRAATCYGAGLIAVSGERFERQAADTTKAYRHIPMLRVAQLADALPFDCTPVAVELVEGARSLVDYEHPERAFYVFGPEDGTLDGDVLGWCRDVVYIPTNYCMNLAATVNVVLYDRLCKRGVS